MRRASRRRQAQQAVKGTAEMPSPGIGRRQFMRMSVGSLAMSAFGCGQRRDETRTEHSTLTILTEQDEWDLGPGQDDPPKLLVFLPLVARNGMGEIEGRLAESWEHSPDYHTWTVHLRKDIRWHDGVPVTAHDVKFTMDLYMHPAVLMTPPGAFTLTVLDDHRYTIAYHRRATNTGKLCGSPMEDDYTAYFPKHRLEKLDPKDFNSWEFWTHPVGNGPYRYVRHMSKTMMELEANPDYYRGKPKIERVVLKFGDPSATGAITELLSGNVDAVPRVNRMELLRLKGDPRFRLYDAAMDQTSEGDGVILILWNERELPFRDSNVRRALTLAIDRRELHQVLNLPESTPIFDVIFTERQFQRCELPEPLPCDPEQAKRLLDEAGWRDQRGIGLRERDGSPFKFIALVNPNLGGDRAAVYIQAALRRVGVQMDITVLEWEALFRRVMSGEFEAAIPPVMPLDVGSRVLFGERDSSDA